MAIYRRTGKRDRWRLSAGGESIPGATLDEQGRSDIPCSSWQLVRMTVVTPSRHRPPMSTYVYPIFYAMKFLGTLRLCWSTLVVGGAEPPIHAFAMPNKRDDHGRCTRTNQERSMSERVEEVDG